MSKVRTTSRQDPQQHRRAEEFHKKLEKGAKTVAVHRLKIQQGEHDAQPAAEPNRDHAKSQAAHLITGESVKPQTKRPVGDPGAGQHPGALLKR